MNKRKKGDVDAGKIKGTGFPDTSGNKVLVISSENELSKIHTGGWNVEGDFICVK